LFRIRALFLIRFTVAALSTRVTAAIGFKMTNDDFRRRAAECLRSAQRAANDCTKGLWLSMAQRWLDRAETPVRVELPDAGRHGQQA
jgi:hypothetical protein